MKKGWDKCKKILCVRADNMGDVLMAEPAIRAIKESIAGVRISLLTSSYGSGIADYMPEVDEVIVANVPWVKTQEPIRDEEMLNLIVKLRAKKFDGAVIFTNYSQSAAPAATIAFLAGIKKRLAYGREKFYGLLTDWVPDTEPFTEIVHGVVRNLNLVADIGAIPSSRRIQFSIPLEVRLLALGKLKTFGVGSGPKIIIHPGVRDDRWRAFPNNIFTRVAGTLSKDHAILLTGSKDDFKLCEDIKKNIGGRIFNLAGRLTLGEFAAVVEDSELLIAPNTGAIHIASAANTPTVVLYARTNMEHTPWMVRSRVLYYDVGEYQGRAPILSYSVKDMKISRPNATQITTAARELLAEGTKRRGKEAVWA